MIFPDQRSDIIIRIGSPFPILPLWGDAVRGNVSCTYRGSIPRERNPKRMQFVVSIGTAA